MTDKNRYKPTLLDWFWKTARAPYKQAAELADDLHYAAVTNNLWRTQFLLDEYKVDANANQNRALVWAARAGHTEMCTLLLKYGADINAREGTPLIWALSHGHQDTAAAFVDAGADITCRKFEAVYSAAEQKNTALLQKMFRSKYDLRPVAEKLLEKATKNNQTDMVRLYQDYLDKKADEKPLPKQKPPQGPGA